LQERGVKKGVLLVILAIAGQLLASDKIRITVKGYTVESGLFIIHALEAGKPIELLCYQDSPFCGAPAPGDYWMVDWTVPVIEYRGDYVCKEVNLYPIAPEKHRKSGEYCLVKK
jgi:hypothetical protein